MREGIDEVDLKILKCIAGDCRLSFRQIARALNLSTSTVSKRIKRLQESGVLVSFMPIVNPRQLGVVMFAVGIKAGPGHDPRDIAKEIAKSKAVTHVFVTTGSYDLIAIGVANSPEGMLEAIRSLTSVGGVERYEALQIVEVAKESPAEWMTAER